jgi:hypothetical protein
MTSTKKSQRAAGDANLNARFTEIAFRESALRNEIDTIVARIEGEQ